MTDFKKIAKSIVVRFAHICTYGVETVNKCIIMSIYIAFPELISRTGIKN